MSLNIELDHRFKFCCFDIKELLNECYKISTFCTRLKKQCNRHVEKYDPDAYKGHGLEFFVEALIKLSPMDNRIGVRNYNVINSNGDTGVDGFGIGMNGNPATVQVKYRSDKTMKLRANDDHLNNFVTTSLMKYEVIPTDKNNMLVITNADGLHHYTDNVMYMNRVRCIGFEQLRELVDNNNCFWDLFRELAYSKNTI